jgi:Uma2 family endonuclease
MSNAEHLHSIMTVHDYLAFADAHPGQRYELLGGVPVAMAPATYNHQKICGNIDRSLGRSLQGACESLRDMGLASGFEADFMPQPDVMVRCGPFPGRSRWVSDPVVIFEVLSPSTMADDRGYKLKTNQTQFPSLRHIGLVYQDECRVELWSRPDDGAWPEEGLSVYSRIGEVLALPAAGVTLALADIYDGIEVA